MNRTLLCLGLANNKIGDVGANKFADVRITMTINGFANGLRFYFSNNFPIVAVPVGRIGGYLFTVLMTSRSSL